MAAPGNQDMAPGEHARFIPGQERNRARHIFGIDMFFQRPCFPNSFSKRFGHDQGRIGQGKSRRDDIHGDSKRSQLYRHGVGHRFKRRFRSRVSTHFGQRLLRQARADDDNLTGFLLSHIRQASLNAIIESQKLMLDGAVKIVPRQLVQLADLKRKVSVVHQDIDGAILLPSGLDHQINLIFARYVSLKNHASAARALNLIKNFLRGFPVLMIVDDHRCAGFGPAA